MLNGANAVISFDDLMVSVSLSVHNFQKKSPNGFKKFAREIAKKKRESAKVRYHLVDAPF